MAKKYIQITERDISVLSALAKFYVLSAPLLKRLCFPSHKNTRGTRDRLQRLKEHGLINRSRGQIAFSSGNCGSVYFLTAKGTSTLSVWFDDPAYLAINVREPRTDLLNHWLAVTETHTIVEAAIAGQQLVTLDGWLNEWGVVNKDDNEKKQFTLHTHFSDSPPLSCSPDAGFLLSIGDAKKVVYLEQDRATTDPRRLAHKKIKGFAELFKRQGHLKHFPEATLQRFTVLVVTTDAQQRNAIAREVGKLKDFHPDLWLFVDQNELTPETFLHEPITYNCDLEAGPLIKKPADAPVEVSA